MASTWSSLKFELIGTGEQTGTWGATTNANLGDAIEQAIGGKADITMSSTSETLTLTDTTNLQDARALYLNLTGTPGGAATLNVPAVEKAYIVKNGTTGGYAVTVKVSGQTGVSVPNGKTMVLYDNGTDVVDAITHLSSLTLGSALPAASGGTGITSLGTGVATALGQNVTGSGGIALATSPTFTTPVLGTPTSGTLTNCTGLPISTGVSGLGTNVATFLATPSSTNLAAAVTDETGSGALVFATSPTLVTPAIGTPSSGTLTNCTGLPVSTGVSGLGTGVATFLATPSSANLAAAVTDETGSGALVFGTSPTLTTPNLGTPSSATLTNATGLPLSTGVTGTLPLANGGTGAALTDPNADRILFWDDSAGAMTFLQAGSGLSISGTTLTATGTGGSVTSVDVSGGTTGLTTSGGPITSSGTITLAGTLAVANGGTGVTTSTGTGSVVLSTSPTLTTPNLGTPSAATLTNATGLPIATGVSGLGSGVATFLATPSSANLKAAVTDETGSGALVFGTSPTLTTPNLGTPASGTLTNCTGLPVSTGVSGLGSGVATFLATPSSANLAAAVTGETGSGALVFATSPTLVTPVLGTPTSGNLTNCTVDGTNEVGYRNVPPVGTKTTSYTLQTSDVGKYVQVGSGGSITIPDATFSEGDVISIFNNTSGGITITCSITTAYISGGASSSASVTLATHGVATVLFISGTICVITGNVT